MQKIACPSCGETLLATRAHAGRVMQCPACAASVNVPAERTVAPAPADAAEAADERAAADAISRAVGDRPRGVPRPRPPARPVARKVVLVVGAVGAVLFLVALLYLSAVLG